MFKQSLVVVLLGPLLCAAALAQASNTPARFHLKGVLISDNGRSAWVNSRPSRVGDRVAGAEIVAIEEGAVRIRTGSQELLVRVGATVNVDRPSSVSIRRRPEVARPMVARDSALASATPAAATPRGKSALAEHPVQSGETLSGIAHRYLGEGVTMNQMMVALYEANPSAFNNNINILYAGVRLKIPAGAVLRQQAPEVANATVLSHTQRWQSPSGERNLHANPAHGGQYGPVKAGETLSAIARDLGFENVSMNQMMMALFDANPQAFDGNINLLHSGATLQIPAADALGDQPPAAATTEVMRQTESWRAGVRQHSRSTTAHARITPMPHGAIASVL